MHLSSVEKGWDNFLKESTHFALHLEETHGTPL